MGNFVKVATVGDIPSGTGKTVDVNGEPVAVFNVDGTFHAIHNTCLHHEGPLGEGDLTGKVVACPWHSWEYEVDTGKCLTDPGSHVRCYEVKIEGEDVLVSVSPKVE